MAELTDETLRVHTALVEAFLFASTRGQVTRGFATVKTSIIQAKTGLGCPAIFRAVKELAQSSLVIPGELDAQGMDVSITAIGLGRYLGGVK